MSIKDKARGLGILSRTTLHDEIERIHNSTYLDIRKSYEIEDMAWRSDWEKLQGLGATEEDYDACQTYWLLGLWSGDRYPLPLA